MNLIDYVAQVSLEDFGKPFRHQAVWNTRLRTTGGRFFPKDGHLDFNPQVLDQHGLEVFRKIVRHELCHYHLYFEGKGYRHGDREFKELLAQVDGLRFVPRSNQIRSYQSYLCSQCGLSFTRQQKINLKKYACGRCRGRLLFQGLIHK